MKTRANPVVAPRKRPRQSCSTQICGHFGSCCSRFAARGCRRFTTARVAETVGVSVGSLYQYFPNKEAILFGLQASEWAETGGQINDLLADASKLPMARLREMVLAFFRSVCEEAALRTALEDAASLYRDAPAARQHRQTGRKHMLAFMAEALPAVDARKRQLVADAVATVATSTGKSISEQGRPRVEADAMAKAVGEMLCGYLERLAQSNRR